jgi:hypothetical protein
MPSPKDESPIESNEPDGEREVAQYRAPRIDLRLLTIVVQQSPYSRRTPLSRSRKPSLRRRWSS